MRFLVTGILGFIGSYFARLVLADAETTENPDVSVVGVGRNTDTRNLRRLDGVWERAGFKLVYCDIARDDVSELFEDVDYAVNFAAKTFVDHSIRDPEPFIQSNIVGTFRLLEAARKSRQLKRYIQISTDEVYGQILEGAYREDAPLNPRNPYASTKAAADMLCLAYYNTYGLPVIITRTENNYGPYQHPQKAIPTFVRKALNNEALPIYGDGKHRRMWLHVEDHCRAALHLLGAYEPPGGKLGEVYHVAGEQELENLELARIILRILGKPEDMVKFIPDFDVRPGHDRRYALNVEKLRATGWMPRIGLQEGLKMTVDWYVKNRWWLC